MSLPRIDNWLDLVFWIFAAGVAGFIVWTFLTIIYQSIRMFGDTAPRRRRGAASGGGMSSTDTSGITFGGDTSYSTDIGSDSGSDSGGGDSGGNYGGGGGDFGGGGSSGGWSD